MKANIFILRTLILIALIGFTSCSTSEVDDENKTDADTPIISLQESRFQAELPGYFMQNMAIDNNHVFYFITAEIDWEEYIKMPEGSAYLPIRYYISRKSMENENYEVLNDRFIDGKLCFDKNNQLWMYNYNTVYLYKNGKMNKIIELPEAGGIFQFLSVDNDNNVWAGGWGLYKIDSQLNVTHYTENHFDLPSITLDNIHVDKANNIWVAGWGGILKIANGQWTAYSQRNTGFPFQRNWSLVTDKNGHLWVGEGWDNENQCLIRFNGSDWETVNPRNGNNEVVKGTVRILQSDGNKIYVVSEQSKNDAFYSNELLTFDGENWSKISEIPEDDKISQLIVDEYQHVVWVVTLNKGIFKIPF